MRTWRPKEPDRKASGGSGVARVEIERELTVLERAAHQVLKGKSCPVDALAQLGPCRDRRAQGRQFVLAQNGGTALYGHEVHGRDIAQVGRLGKRRGAEGAKACRATDFRDHGINLERHRRNGDGGASCAAA